MNRDYFSEKAGTYEQNRTRVDNVGNIAVALLGRLELGPSMHLLDFGSGTGLLLERIAPFVGKITALDVSPSMNRQLEDKRARLPCELEIIEADLETTDITGQYDGIMSSMTLHHIRDLDPLFRKFFDLVRPGGFIALADLDREDGSFHTEDTGVHHFGFDRDHLASVASGAGFSHIEITTAGTIMKPQGEYPVFLLTARRGGG